MKKFFSFVSGFMTGAVVASVLALLFTPDSGASLREMLQGKYFETKDQLSEAAKQRRSELESELAKLRQS